MRTLITHNPFADGPSSWVVCPGSDQPPLMAVYRRRFSLADAATVRIHVSADERYVLFLDGRRIGRGPERGTPDLWFFETYDLPLTAGDHALVAQVWALGALAPLAQMSAAPGLTVRADGPHDALLGTGKARWEAKPLTGHRFVTPVSPVWPAYFVGPNEIVDAARDDADWQGGAGEGWEQVPAREEDQRNRWGVSSPHALAPAPLPPETERERRAGTVRHVAAMGEPDLGAVPIRASDDRPAEHAPWQGLIDGHVPLTIAPHTGRRVILDLGDYICAYPELTVTGGGGSRIELRWAEALWREPGPGARTKGHRDTIEGQYFDGLMGDTFYPDGGAGRRFESVWWRAGRYLQLTARANDEPLTLDALTVRETGYPLEMDSRFHADDPRLARLIPMLLRSLQTSAHETYTDSPYYEQLMYVGDARLEALMTYAIARDDRLPRKALAVFDASRFPGGLTQARYPSREPQLIAPYALCWVAMVHDYALWRGDRPFVVTLLPGVRGVLDRYLASVTDGGVVGNMPGWNFVDGVPSWANGVPPGPAPITWQLVGALAMAAEIEGWAGEPEMDQRWRRHARELAAHLVESSWDERRGLFADDLERRRFSEHTQCLAVLSGQMDGRHRERIAHGLLADTDLERTSYYFTHYLFDTYRALDLGDALLARLVPWFALQDHGFKTTPEYREPARSDSHAWSAHPLYHMFATVLGVRPASFGFQTVDIAPLLGPLQAIGGTSIHPQGAIELDLRREAGRLVGTIVLPGKVTGIVRFGGREQLVTPGRQILDLAGGHR